MEEFITEERKAKILSAKQINIWSSGKNIEFSLTPFNIDWPQYCPVLGLRLDYFRKGRGSHYDYSPSLDRVDPAKGYTPENTRVISNRANRIKNDGTAEEHRKIAAYIEESLSQVKQT